jgi:inositol-phosphate phosphatase/L-galactose 1-phosphate phosphatase
MSSSSDEKRLLMDYLQVGLHAASEAGKLIAAAFREEKSSITKINFTDLVTETDHLCEETMKAIVKERFPDHRFIGEEEASGAAKGAPTLTDDPTWITDPIDGTTNFVHSFPFTCVSIGLAINKRVVVGVVNNPILNEMFMAIRGGGAFLNGKPIHVSSRESLNQALIGTEIGTARDPETLDAMFSRIRYLSSHCRGIRCSGSCALNLCSVAMGRIDAFYEIGFGGCWDVAAGSLIVEEAGGLVLDPSGEEFGLMRRRVLAGTPSIARLAADILSKAPISKSEPS